MKAVKSIFLLAAIYGFFVIVPSFFMEGSFARDEPFTHPQFFYGFMGVALAWQIAFVVIAQDPKRYRPFIFAAIVEKFSFLIASLALFSEGRIVSGDLPAPMIDGIFGIAFIYAFIVTGRAEPEPAD